MAVGQHPHAAREDERNKRGAISQSVAPILGRLDIDAGEYLQRVSGRSRGMEGLALKIPRFFIKNNSHLLLTAGML